MQSLKFIDLFAGIGGFHQALKYKGKCVFASEINLHAAESYLRNHKLLPQGDITKIDAKNIPDHDVLCAGFPCQSFSISGNRKAFGESRGELFFEIIRIAKEKKPSIMLLENVRHILRVDNKKVIFEILKQLDNIGYYTNYSLLNASHYGIPQARKRVYFVCIRKDKNLTYLAPKPTFEKVYLKDVLDKNPVDYLESTRTAIIRKTDCKNTLGPVRIGENKGRRNWQGCGIYSAKGHAITQLAQENPRLDGWYKIGRKIRTLSINEAQKVMGFPETFVLSKSKKRTQLGNAVIPKMVRLVYSSIK